MTVEDDLKTLKKSEKLVLDELLTWPYGTKRATTYEIAQTCGLGLTTVAYAVRKLKRLGILGRGGRNSWFITIKAAPIVKEFFGIKEDVVKIDG